MDKKMEAIVMALRRQLGISRMALGKSANLSPDKLARWEKGRAKFNDEEMKRLFKVIDAEVIARAESAPGPLTNSDNQAFKQNRRAVGITQEEFARRAGLSQTTISSYENGYVTLDAEQRDKIEKTIKALMAKKGAGKKISLKSLMSQSYKPYASFGAEPRSVNLEDQNRALREQVFYLKKIIRCQKEIDELKEKQLKEQGPIDPDIEASFRSEVAGLEEQRTALEDKIAATEKRETTPKDGDD